MARTALVSLVAFLLSVVTCEAATLKYFDCGPPTAPVTVKDVILKPDPAISGEDMSFIMNANTSVPIRGGTVVIIVLFRGIPVHVERDPLCSKTSKCPIDAGDDFDFINSQPLPAVTPGGPYTVRINVLDTTGKVLFCQRMQFQIEKPPVDVTVLGQAASAVRTFLMGHKEDTGAVMEALEKAWHLEPETKAQLRQVLTAGFKIDLRKALSAGVLGAEYYAEFDRRFE